MTWNALSLIRRRNDPIQRHFRPSLETLEDRTVPALLAAAPLWFYQNFQDTRLLNESVALWQNGHSFSRNDMVTLFQFVASEAPKVSSQDLGELRALVAYAPTAGWMPNYVANLSNKVVNYDLSNLEYQGSPFLASGTLQAGDLSSNLLTLVNKWFLGLDLPDSAGPSIAEATLTYKTASGALWGMGGPSYQDITQGSSSLGDCYFLSSLGATVATTPQNIKNMFINNGDGTYTIRFYLPNANGTKFTPDYVTVNTQFPFEYYASPPNPLVPGYYFAYANGGPGANGPSNEVDVWGTLYNNPHNILWVPLLEKAYAQYNAELSANAYIPPQDYLGPGVNSYAVIGSSGGGYPSEALEQILGTTSSYYYFPNDSGSLTESLLVSLLKQGNAVTLVSYDNRHPLNSPVEEYHVYYIIGYTGNSPDNYQFTVVNPWGYQYHDDIRTDIFGTYSATFSFLNTYYESAVFAPL
jgi:hypothetical protein